MNDRFLTILSPRPAMDVRLIAQNDSCKQRTWQLHGNVTVVGRRRDCDLRILSAEVSRRHCLLRIEDGCVTVEDLDSINGTFVNGGPVVGKQALQPGDHLHIGPVEFIVEYEPPPGRDRRKRQPTRAEESIPVESDDEQRVYDVVAPVERTSGSAEEALSKDDKQSFAVLDEEAAADWHLPQTNDLRDLLSQMDQSDSRPPRRKP